MSAEQTLKDSAHKINAGLDRLEDMAGPQASGIGIFVLSLIVLSDDEFAEWERGVNDERTDELYHAAVSRLCSAGIEVDK